MTEEITTDDIEFTKEELEQLIQMQICKHSGRLEVLDPSDRVIVS